LTKATSSSVSNVMLLRTEFVYCEGEYMFRVHRVQAQLVQRHTTGWTVPESIPGDSKIVRTSPENPSCSPSALYDKVLFLPGSRASGSWN